MTNQVYVALVVSVSVMGVDCQKKPVRVEVKLLEGALVNLVVASREAAIVPDDVSARA